MESDIYICDNARSFGDPPIKTMFELNRQLPSGFLEAKRGCSTQFLAEGHFEQYAFNASRCRKATPEEALEYLALKDHSRFSAQCEA